MADASPNDEDPAEPRRPRLVVRRAPLAAWSYALVVPFYPYVWMYRIQREAATIGAVQRRRWRDMVRPIAYLLGLATLVAALASRHEWEPRWTWSLAVSGALVAVLAALSLVRLVVRLTGKYDDDPERTTSVVRLAPFVVLGLVLHGWIPVLQRALGRRIDADLRTTYTLGRPWRERYRLRRTVEQLPDGAPPLVAYAMPLARQPGRAVAVVPLVIAVCIAQFARTVHELGKFWSRDAFDRFGALSVHDLHTHHWVDLARAQTLHLNLGHLVVNVVMAIVVGVLLERRLGIAETASLTAVGIAGSAIGSLALLDPAIVAAGVSGILSAYVGASIALDPRLRTDIGRVGAIVGAIGLSDFLFSTFGHRLPIDFGAHLGGLVAGAVFVLVRAVLWRVPTIPATVLRAAILGGAAVAGLAVVDAARPAPGPIAIADSGGHRVVIARRDVERYIQVALPVYTDLVDVSADAADARLDVIELGSSEARFDQLRTISDRMSAIDDRFRQLEHVPRSMRDVHDLYVTSATEEQRATEQLASAVRIEDDVQVASAVNRALNSGGDALRASQLLRSRAARVEADVAPLDELAAHAGVRLQPIAEREQRLRSDGSFDRFG